MALLEMKFGSEAVAMIPDLMKITELEQITALKEIVKYADNIARVKELLASLGKK